MYSFVGPHCLVRPGEPPGASSSVLAVFVRAEPAPGQRAERSDLKPAHGLQHKAAAHCGSSGRRGKHLRERCKCTQIQS